MPSLKQFVKSFAHNPFEAMASLPGTLEALGTGIYRGIRGDASWNPYDEGASVADISALGTRWAQEPNKRQAGRAIGTAIGSYFTGGALSGYLGSTAAGGAASGALWGGAQAAGTGEDPWKGAARGGLYGYAAGSLADAYSGGSAATTSGGSGDMYSLSAGKYGDLPAGSEQALTGGGIGYMPQSLGSMSASGYQGGLGYSPDLSGASSGVIEGTTIPSLGAMARSMEIAPGFSAPPLALGGGIDAAPWWQQGGDYLRRMWKDPIGRQLLLRAGTGLYANRKARRLERGLRERDVTTLPGYRAGERAVIRRASAGGYADSSRMLAELSDYGQQNYDRFAENERRNYQARMGGLMSEINTLGLLSLGLGF